MSCFLLPGTLLQEIESLVGKFWWNDGKKEKIHWLNWDKLCTSKKEGGLGFRDIEEFHLAFLSSSVP